MKTLDRYIARSLIGNALLVLAALAAFGSFITFIGDIGDIGKGSYSLGDVAMFTLLSLPQQIYQVFPVGVLIGALISLGGLAGRNELMVVRAAGVSVPRLARSALGGGVILAIVCIVLSEVIAPPAQHYATRLKTLAIYNRVGSSGAGGIWTREGRVFVNVRQMTGNKKMRGIYIFRFGPDRRLLSADTAAGAQFTGGAWHLDKQRETRFSGTSATTGHAPQPLWRNLLNPDVLSLFVVDTSSLSAYGLYKYIKYLRANGLDSHGYEVAFWAKVVKPISVLVMVLVAVPFAFGPLRSVSGGQRILVGMLVGVAFYVINVTLAQSGSVFKFNPILVAALPTAVLAVLSTIAIKRV
jgi:lipopolysaccharide export system permease protein